MFETRIVRAKGTRYDWKAVAVRLAPIDGEPWHIFVSHGNTGMWLTPLETLTPLDEIDLSGMGEERIARHCALLGASWDDLWEDPFDVIALQCRFLDDLPPRAKHLLENGSPEDLAAERIALMGMSDGEQLVREMVGTDALAQRN